MNSDFSLVYTVHAHTHTHAHTHRASQQGGDNNICFHTGLHYEDVRGWGDNLCQYIWRAKGHCESYGASVSLSQNTDVEY